ncbi:hypothetical protein VTK56DRAFT_702 [Thermocarpiscus australiensis]
MPTKIVLKGTRLPAVKLARRPDSTPSELVALLQGIDIALEYFNSSSARAISKLTVKAREWADRYFKGYRYAARRPTALLGTFPNLFNLRVQGRLRLQPSGMPTPSSTPEPEGASSQDLRRAERKAMNSESFPEFAEPALASEADLDQIVRLSPRQRPNGTTKPTMRVDAAMLRESGLLRTLPEFLAQLARANLETETMLANNPDAVRLELNEEEAAEKPHVEMNLYAGLVEKQRRRRQRRLILPDGRPLPSAEDANEASGDGPGDESGDESGYESDASTSTTASLRANLGKRKAAAMADSEDAAEAGPPNKIRLQYQYPPPKLKRFDMEKRRLITIANPDAVPNDPFETRAAVEAEAERPAENPARASPAPSATTSVADSTSSSSSCGPTRIIKIRVNNNTNSSSSSSSNSADSSRASTPDSQGSRVIILRDPRYSSPPSSSSSSSSSSSTASSARSSPRRPPPRIKVKMPKKAAEVQAQAPRSSGGSSGGSSASAAAPSPPRPSSSGSGSGSGSDSSGSRRIRIKVLQRSGAGGGEQRDAAPRAGRKRLIEEVDG